MKAQVLFSMFFSRKDPHLNAAKSNLNLMEEQKAKNV